MERSLTATRLCVVGIGCLAGVPAAPAGTAARLDAIH